MSYDPNDPRWTAYLLGELEAADREELDEILAANPEANEDLAALRDITEALQAELPSEPVEGLSDLQRQRIVSSSANSPRRARFYAAGALTAVAAATLWWATSQGSHEDKQLADHFKRTSSMVEVATSATSESAGQHPGASPLGQGPGGAFESLDSHADQKGEKIALQEARKAGVLGTINTDGTTTEAPPPANRNSGTPNTVVEHPKTPVEALDEAPPEVLRELESLGYFSNETPAYYEWLASQERQAREAAGHNPFVSPTDEPLSTFSIDVDTAAYSLVRSYLRRGVLPAASAVRIEELVNYFSYELPDPATGEPLSLLTEVADSPWSSGNKLVRIGMKGKELSMAKRPAANLVFLVDVSGSMNGADRLPLLKRSFAMLLDRLDQNDRVSIVTYAGSSGVALRPTAVEGRKRILSAMQRLEPSGSTNGSAGIELAYEIAQESFIKGGINRVILATDGDFNVGATSHAALLDLIEDKARSDVFLTVLGFGIGGNGDGTMELLADKGNGNYAFIDTLAEAKKVLVDQLQGTLITVAKDVKLQIEFNPARVAKYRLIGFENRVLAAEEFNDDGVDAGELGAGQAVTALYEVVPTSKRGTDELRYQPDTAKAAAAANLGPGELGYLKVRFKTPTGKTSTKRELVIRDGGRSFAQASVDLRFAGAVAAFGMLLRHSPHKGSASFARVEDWAKGAQGRDPHEYRAGFLDLVRRAKRLWRQR